MKKLFTDGFNFKKYALGTDFSQVEADSFEPVRVPHDWAISNIDWFYESASGWYKKEFEASKKEGKTYIIRFEGVYMDSEVWLNGVKVKEWKYGYSTFDVDITEALKDGHNVMYVGAHFETPNSRWYSGAGIYRNVWFIEKNNARFEQDGIYVHTEKTDGTYEVTVEAECVQAEGMLVGLKFGESNYSTEVEDGKASISFTVEDVQEWSPEEPNLYTLMAALITEEGAVVDSEEVVFGFKDVEVDPNTGFWLNGKNIKLNGVCLHHDCGALGAAVHKDAVRRQLTIMKEQGVNAIRTSHNMPAVELMELADEMGFLILSEAFDMWERAKTKGDYARFFPEWYKKDVASWVRRDRNHVSVFGWSIGNEIYDMHADERGYEVCLSLKAEVEKNDYMGNAFVTFGSNYMPWEGAQHCAEAVMIPGYNYGEAYYNAHHAEHPDWVIYGSETASTCQSRGVYKFPLKQEMLADVDEQCSSLGNCTTSWGARRPEACVIAERDHKFSLGQFIWTGIDYIGEPTPYHTKNSYFGQVDTAGFPKDSYYIYQAEWVPFNDRPVIHLFPYWNFNDGQTIDVRICTNASCAELFLNGKSCGKKTIDHINSDTLTANYIIPFEKGVMRAVAYDENGNIVAEEEKYSFEDSAAIRLIASNSFCEEIGRAEGEFAGTSIKLTTGKQRLTFVEINMLDKNGNPVEDANDRVSIAVTGSAKLVGLDSGDSTDFESYQASEKNLFNGKLLAMIEGTEDGEAVVTVSRTETSEIRNIELVNPAGREFGKDNTEKVIEVRIHPEEAKEQEVIYEVVNSTGIKVDLATVKDNKDGTITLTAHGDGDFCLRALAYNGKNQAKVISVLDFASSGIGAHRLNPYNYITGGLYDDTLGYVTNGNEHGFATSRDSYTGVGFTHLDFGETGADEIYISVFELGSNPVDIEIWDGKPHEEGSELLDVLHYHKQSIWNTYQPETYKLSKRYTGVKDIFFGTKEKIHVQGFEFHKHNISFDKLYPAMADSAYGDTLTVTDRAINGIGNNVTIEFNEMDFGEEGIDKITICGRTPNPKNTIHIRFVGEEKEVRQAIEFPGSEAETESEFKLEKVAGKQKVGFIFLPGSDFDFSWFKFGKENE